MCLTWMRKQWSLTANCCLVVAAAEGSDEAETTQSISTAGMHPALGPLLLQVKFKKCTNLLQKVSKEGNIHRQIMSSVYSQRVGARQPGEGLDQNFSALTLSLLDAADVLSWRGKVDCSIAS